MIISTYKDKFRAWRLILVGFWEKEKDTNKTDRYRTNRTRTGASNFPRSNLGSRMSFNSNHSSKFTDFGYEDGPIILHSANNRSETKQEYSMEKCKVVS